MKFLSVVFLIVFALGCAQKPKRPVGKAPVRTAGKSSAKKVEVEEVAQVETPAPPPPLPPVKSYFQVGTSLSLWQENIKTKKGANRGNLYSQFQAINVAFSYNRELRRPGWRQSYIAEVSAGTLKSKGDTAQIQDELRNQTWSGVTVSPGLAYKTSPASEIGLFVPFMFRGIRWQLAPASTLELEQNSFSVGLAAMYLNQINERSALRVTLTNNYMWDALIWTVGWDYNL